MKKSNLIALEPTLKRLGKSIGDPKGKLAYAYIRVSSTEQAEEGASGLPRQIEHIHEIALSRGFCIPHHLIFADDHTGFEFHDRPELSRLRQELRNSQRLAHTVIMEQWLGRENPLWRRLG